MAVWRNYPSVKVASLQKINFPADQWPDNSKWFKFLSSASPLLHHTFSFTLYSLTSQLPHMLVSLFIHAQYHMLPFPWYFFSHLVSLPTLHCLLLVPSPPQSHSPAACQTGLWLCICMTALVLQLLLHPKNIWVTPVAQETIGERTKEGGTSKACNLLDCRVSWVPFKSPSPFLGIRNRRY